MHNCNEITEKRTRGLERISYICNLPPIVHVMCAWWPRGSTPSLLSWWILMKYHWGAGGWHLQDFASFFFSFLRRVRCSSFRWRTNIKIDMNTIGQETSYVILLVKRGCYFGTTVAAVFVPCTKVIRQTAANDMCAVRTENSNLLVRPWEGWTELDEVRYEKKKWKEKCEKWDICSKQTTTTTAPTAADK